MTLAGAVHMACGEATALLAQAPAPERWLTTTETRRVAAIQSDRRRRSFLAARWQARWLLGQVLGGAPVDWHLDAPNDAPPRMAQRPDLVLSISHSGDLVATALAARGVGIDLEVPRPGRDITGLRELCCTASEQSLFAGLDADREAAIFHELWTVKEAWLKRRGEWLAPSRLQQIDASPDAGGGIRTWCDARWQLALCTEGEPQIRWWTPAPSNGRRWAVRAGVA